MLQEDSNGESSFEIVHDTSEKTGSTSTVSSGFSMSSPPGNLLANVPPPATLPDFKVWPTAAPEAKPAFADVPTVGVTSVPQIPAVRSQPTLNNVNPLPLPENEQFPRTQFSAAIPPSKGIQLGPTLHHKANEKDVPGGFMGYFKEAFTSGGVLSKMAEKAKSSVDSIITTLDPQMSEYIYSEGETEVTVISDNEDEVGAIREAFHSVFGKAWVNGIKLNIPGKRSQAIGFESGRRNAEENIKQSMKYRNTPTVAMENILIQENNEWFDLTILVLKDMEKQITVQTFSQATPVPVEEFLKNVTSEMPETQSLSVEEKLAIFAQARSNWQQHISGVSRKEVIFLAAKTLVRLYKNKLSLIH
ncbi:unnamed protein product [Phaedon cochleariae]|uniref:Non-canonical purine NTP phosphatase/PRRC1 domain-containing protein n=1 Tax=Phaedon cochleariae TaxID=80249 RepID=A0A9P0GRJ2_PHACE|nr:unnamed protein product [Phaedon cochleariae]